jgi:predicted dehydrogenase
VIRAGVIGAGNMGSHHARVYAALTGACTLAGVYDPDTDRAATVASRWDARSYDTLEDMLRDVDVVSVASPSSLHFHHTALALEHGLDVLVEKPVSLTVENAKMLERMASLRPSRPVVQVGHIEHFNPAIVALRTLLAEHSPIAIDMQRLGPFDGRNPDMDVVQDLMLHDIHVLISVAGSPLVRVQAAGRRVRNEDQTDYAVATFVFENGLIATLAASRVTEEKIRRLTVTASDAHITLDSMRRSLELSRWTSLRDDAGESAGYRQESVLERVFVPIEEPLVAQIQSFLRCVRDRSAPEVPLSMGTACLQTVDVVRERIAAQAAATGAAGVLTV